MSENLVSRDKKRIQIPTSGQCNNNCLFCSDRSSNDGRFTLATRFFSLYKFPFLTKKAFTRRSKKLNGVDSILFTGGEPTLNPDLASFVKLAKISGWKNTGLQTNGRLLCCKDFYIELFFALSFG